MTEIRRATFADAGVLAEMNLEVHELHVTNVPYLFKPGSLADARYMFEGWLENDNTHFLIAYAGARAVGYAMLNVVHRPANQFVKERHWLYIEQLGVRHEYRGQGHGSALIQAARELARELGLARIELDTWAFNTPAHEFFRRQGFQPVSIKFGMETR
jgi:ribosomal protein S18 acetylase RimI-like enzyme